METGSSTPPLVTVTVADARLDPNCETDQRPLGSSSEGNQPDDGQVTSCGGFGRAVSAPPTTLRAFELAVDPVPMVAVVGLRIHRR